MPFDLLLQYISKLDKWQMGLRRAQNGTINVYEPSDSLYQILKLFAYSNVPKKGGRQSSWDSKGLKSSGNRFLIWGIIPKHPNIVYC